MIDTITMALVLEPTELSVAKAERFGTITYLFHTRKAHPGAASARFAASVVDRARELGFNPARDYFVLTGQLLPMVMATAAMVAHYGQLRGLHFNGHDSVREYQCVIVGERTFAPVTSINDSSDGDAA